MNDLTLIEFNKKGELFLTDKGSIHNFLSIYEELFCSFRYKEINIFEVGYQNGASCKLWNDYFPKAKIKSIDICHWTPSVIELVTRIKFNIINYYIPPGDRVSLELMDVKDITAEYFSDFPPDIAIDDGSHYIQEQIHFIKIIYPILKEGGLLIIEDIQDINNDKIENKS